MPKVSIVIPVYNTYEYLSECLDSVINQTLSDIEIIVVNDGSTDNSEELCKRYACCDSRIKLISQENRGVAVARRVGANAATSPYVGFVDSDDTIESDYYESLLADMADCDLVTSAARYEDGYLWKDNIPSGIYSSQTDMQYIIDNMIMVGDSYTRGISGAIPCKLFKRDLACEIFDTVNPKIYLSEDVEFICRYLLRCEAVNVTDICKYNYRTRHESICHLKHEDVMINFNMLYLSLRDAFMGHPRQQRLIEQLEMYIASYIPELPFRMGFAPQQKLLKFVNPIFNELRGQKIALYGAGNVGLDYYLHLLRAGHNPVVWVDKNYEKYEGLPVNPVTDLKVFEYEVIVIAVNERKLAESIKEELCAMGLEAEKILWNAPICVL